MSEQEILEIDKQLKENYYWMKNECEIFQKRLAIADNKIADQQALIEDLVKLLKYAHPEESLTYDEKWWKEKDDALAAAAKQKE